MEPKTASNGRAFTTRQVKFLVGGSSRYPRAPSPQ